MPHIFQLLGYALIPAVAMILAGAWAVWRPPNENWRSAFMHFAAGLIFAVLSVEFLPDLLHEHSALMTGIGFALGTTTMLAVQQWSEKGRAKTSNGGEGVSQGLIVASAVDIAVDGLMLGIGFAAGVKQGLLLTLALTFEMVTLGLAITLELQQGRKLGGNILLNLIALAAVLVISAGLGGLGLSILSGSLLVGVIAFGAAALLFLVTEELLTEAHEVEENPWLTAAFFVGFLVILLLELAS